MAQRVLVRCCVGVGLAFLLALALVFPARALALRGPHGLSAERVVQTAKNTAAPLSHTATNVAAPVVKRTTQAAGPVVRTVTKVAAPVAKTVTKAAAPVVKTVPGTAASSAQAAAKPTPVKATELGHSAPSTVRAAGLRVHRASPSATLRPVISSLVPTVQAAIHAVFEPVLQVQRALFGRTPLAVPPAAPGPVPPAPVVPLAAGSAAGAGSAGNFFFELAVFAALVGLGLPRLLGRRRFSDELGPPAPFASLLADPG